MTAETATTTPTSAASPRQTLAELRLSLPVVATLAALSVLLGVGPLITSAITRLPLLALPAAAGLPSLTPTLRLWPLGDSTWSFWAVDTLAAVIMLVIVALRLANSRRRHPSQGRVRRFFDAWSAVILGVVIGNVVRGVFTSFVVQTDIATYAGYLATNVMVSALFGALLGLIPAAVATIVPSAQRRTT